MKPGSRATGLELLRTYLENTLENSVDDPHLYIFNTCINWIRTVPMLPRSEKDLDDVDSDTEDHLYDASRYRLITKKYEVMSQEGLDLFNDEPPQIPLFKSKKLNKGRLRLHSSYGQ
jgi:hypothetical protein